MKPLKMLTFGTCALALVFIMATFMNSEAIPVKKSNTTLTGNGFALLELFTSEGCSSCPAADDLLAKIQKESSGKPVYVLAYHVDYWNNLGWKDVFSKAEFSKRQREYGRWLGNPQIYTPQVVINGRYECVGSDEATLRDAITTGLSASPLATVTLQAQQNADKLTVNYQAAGNATDTRLLIAVVQKSAVSKVARGENSGRTLSHAQIVRELQAITLSAENKGTSYIKAPQGFNTQNWEIVGFLQNTTTGEVLSATRADLKNNGTTKNNAI